MLQIIMTCIIFLPIYIYEKRQKQENILDDAGHYIFHAFELWHKRCIYMHSRPKYYINLLSESKLLPEVYPKKDEVSSYKQA